LQHRLREVAEPGILDQVAGGAKFERMQRMLLVLHRRHHHRLGHRVHGLHVLDQLKARAIAQVQIDQHDVELVLGDQPPALAQRACLADQMDACVGQQLLRNDAPHVGVVVDQDHPGRLFGLPGQKVRPEGRCRLWRGRTH